MSVRILHGDCRDVLLTLPADSFDCCVTSPPYYGLRDYGTATWDGGDAACDHIEMSIGMSAKNTLGHNGNLPQTNSANVGKSRQYASICGKCGAKRIDAQIGLEPTMQSYLETMVGVCREVRRVLKPEGTCWLNIGDSYAGYHGNKNATYETAPSNRAGYFENQRKSTVGIGSKQKDLMMIPNRLAIMLQSDGWYVRSEIIWHKLNPMPESVTDRPTSAHEKVWLLTKSARYWYDADAISEEFSGVPYTGRGNGAITNGDRADKGRTIGMTTERRNARNVWSLASQPFRGSHYAVMPAALAERCIKAGCPVGGHVLDPFFGAGTTGLVADRLGRNCTGIELNPTNSEMASNRIEGDAPLFAEVTI